MPEEHQNYVIQWEKNCFSSWRNPPCKAGNTQQMFCCHQNLMCPMDVLVITGKSSNASSRIIELRAGLIRNLMSFKALYFWQLLEKTQWTYLMDSSSSKKLTCKTWGKSWRSLKIFVSVKHTKRMNCTSFISDVKNRQKQSKRTSPLCTNWQRTVTLEFSRTEWYEIKSWWQSGKMRFEKSCWRIKNSTWQNVWS